MNFTDTTASKRIFIQGARTVRSFAGSPRQAKLTDGAGKPISGCLGLGVGGEGALRNIWGDGNVLYHD